MATLAPATAAALLAMFLALAWPPPAGATPELLSPDAVLQAVNQYRQMRALPVLAPHARLQAIAQAHSGLMAMQDRLSHAGFDQRMALSEGTLCVENLAAGHTRADALLAHWQVSPSHHANLLESQVHWVGVAVVGRYITLLACRLPAGAQLRG